MKPLRFPKPLTKDPLNRYANPFGGTTIMDHVVNSSAAHADSSSDLRLRNLSFEERAENLLSSVRHHGYIIGRIMPKVKEKMQDDADFLELGGRIRKIQDDLNLTQEEFASHTGISLRSLRYYQSNTQIPSAAALRKILDYTAQRGFPYNGHWLLTGLGTPLASSPEGDGKFLREEDMEIMRRQLETVEGALNTLLVEVKRLRGDVDKYCGKSAGHPMSDRQAGTG